MGIIDAIYGAILIGVVLASILYGSTFVQMWYYWINYPSDSLRNKFLVSAVFILDTSHQVLISHGVYTYLITRFREPAEPFNVVWSLNVTPFLNGIITFLVQCFLAFRVYKLSNRNRLITGFVACVIVVGFALSIVLAVKAVYIHILEDLVALETLSKIVIGLAAAGDVLIALLLCYLLLGSRTGFRGSDTVIKKLVVFSINTGLLTSIFAMASVVSLSLWPKTSISLIFNFCLARLYCNTLLATLNARKGLRDLSRSDNISLDVQGRGASSLGTSSRRTQNNISVKIDATP